MELKPEVFGLSVVIPMYNAEPWIEGCIQSIHRALGSIPNLDYEVVVIDDGSTDDSRRVAANFLRESDRVITKVNGGRLTARIEGMKNAIFSHVLLIDTKVRIESSSALFVVSQLQGKEDSIWVAHVEVQVKGNPLARVWRFIESIFWRNYWKNPRFAQIKTSNFEQLPKGTTALVGPRKTLLEAMEDSLSHLDARFRSDDTRFLRKIANSSPIFISPEYRAIYFARSRMREFLTHSFGRGVYLIDGFLADQTYLSKYIRSYLLFGFPLWIACSLYCLIYLGGGAALLPVYAGVCILLLISLIGLRLGAKFGDAIAIVLLGAPFALAYTLGMYKGFFLLLRSKR